MATKIQFRRGTELEWNTADPILSIAEVGFETDTAKFKIGDGSSNWSELSYYYSDDFIATSASAYALSQANAYTDSEISNLIDTAPGALDTLNELAAALGDDANFSTTVTNNLATKLSIATASSTYLTQVSASTIVTYVITEKTRTVTSNYTIDSSNNAMSVGTTTIANGVTVTIPSGSWWAIL